MSNIEATIICIDNSDYNMNEDIVPNRFMSQIDCVNVLCCNKTSMHYKNSIGVLVMAGDGIKVKVSLTNDIGQLLSCIHDIKIDGSCDIIRSLLIAQLALKHRVDKNLEQKIIVFIGSPIEVNEKQLINTGKQLKKNNISIDIISYGNINKNRDKLNKLFESTNNNGNCRIIECPEDEDNLSKYVLNKILSNSNFNMNNLDEDEQLITAMELSMSTANNARDGGNTSSNNNTQSGSNINSRKNPNDLPTVQDIENMKDIDNELKEALLLSLREYNEKNKNDNESQGENINDKTNSDLKNGEDITIVNEEYKNIFDNEKTDLQKKQTEEKKENESYEKVFKICKDESIDDENNKFQINPNVYANAENNGENGNNETKDGKNASSIQDTSYISQILEKIPGNSTNLLDKNSDTEKEGDNKDSK
ncbi:hypothetical protein YYG_02346 [Plasmodium vinckei petteri]|uniref:26S proteasome regulatory subunit RPN10, putative n=2 Tax=Plasmodium vinckei TaxID=5860 RepID=W7AKW3_PLAVN|nr:hypothetical protein YYG_02346 [Plasmodium vinckei petteri]CAD2098563.1 26S proteasome regulatory subunit RPN10, putative [Plasmodium vinckei lentum]CAD2109771.1 26S proteasome regulatory subunit RPN10, putative [Plasmodium vinckei petteri]